MTLSPEAARVLGVLMEKEMVTPDTYPLSLNALTVASNQRSSRDPVMELSEDQVRDALAALQVEALAAEARENGRVVKYEHRIRTVLNLRRDETAVMCLLLLRGPQTPGELRSRADRMFAFDDLAQLQATLERLGAREQPMVVQLARLPGSREARWAHLLAGPVAAGAGIPPHGARADDATELEQLRRSVEQLEARVEALERLLAAAEPPSHLSGSIEQK